MFPFDHNFHRLPQRRPQLPRLKPPLQVISCGVECDSSVIMHISLMICLCLAPAAPAPAPAAPATEASGIGVVSGAVSGGQKLQAETVSAETLDFLKVRASNVIQIICTLVIKLV